jgi:hypothetical protein
MDERKLKTRCYYTDFVNHMIRFYLSTPETLKMDGKRKADIDNWLAVQDVWRKLGTDDRNIMEQIYKAHYRVPEGVRMYCENTGADSYKSWMLLTKTCYAIAKRRGLI